MKTLKYSLFFGLIFSIFACSNSQKKESKQKIVEPIKTEVIVLGTIHGGHLKSKTYGIKQLTTIIQKINPDAILAEIPPDRFNEAMKQFKAHDSIWEARVSLFPEYVNVIFPLTKTMSFEIIPTAGWSKEMAISRRDKLKAIATNVNRKADWDEYLQGEYKSDSIINASGSEENPLFVNSEAYDKAVDVWAEPYNRLFNEELGLGGWDNINKAHFANITKAIDSPRWHGKRLLITYGAGHKGWFLRELKKRNDIKLIPVSQFIN